MRKIKQNESQSPLSTNCKIYCISWKDERWSASKEDLKELNAMLKANAKPNLSLFRRLIDMIFCLKRVTKWITKSGFGS